MSASVYSICYSPDKSKLTDPPKFYRVPLDSANLIAQHGIEGDNKAGKNPNRNLNIMSYSTLEALAAEGFQTQPGEMGEQLILRGVEVDSLPEGTQLHIGDSAVVELTKPREGCSWFESIQGKHPSEAANRMGMMAKVVTTGTIRVGDAVRVVQPA